MLHSEEKRSAEQKKKRSAEKKTLGREEKIARHSINVHASSAAL